MFAFKLSGIQKMVYTKTIILETMKNNMIYSYMCQKFCSTVFKPCYHYFKLL